MRRFNPNKDAGKEAEVQYDHCQDCGRVFDVQEKKAGAIRCNHCALVRARAKTPNSNGPWGRG